jgi:DNA-binding NarL/FixJ family response regulator
MSRVAGTSRASKEGEMAENLGVDLSTSAAPQQLGVVAVIDTSAVALSRVRDLLEPERRIVRVQFAHEPSLTNGCELVIVATPPAVDWQNVTTLASAGLRVLVLDGDASARSEDLALEAAAIGYLPLSIPPSALRRALYAALGGEWVFSRQAVGRWLKASRKAPQCRTPVSRLTARQQEILSLIARGAADKEIAAHLGIAVATANKHVANILRRLGVPNRAAAVAITEPERWPEGDLATAAD